MRLVMCEEVDKYGSLKSRRKSKFEEGRKKFKVFNIFYLRIKWWWNI